MRVQDWRFYPRFSKVKLMELYHDNRLLFGKDGKSQPRYKVFLSEVQQGRTPVSVLHFRDVRHTDEDAKGLAKLVGKGMMSFPKPVRLSTSAKPQSPNHRAKLKALAVPPSLRNRRMRRRQTLWPANKPAARMRAKARLGMRLRKAI